MNTLNRRRFIGISAAAAGAAAVGFARTEAPEPYLWRGTALGAEAELRLYHPDRSFARHLIGRVLAETERLENIFSLYRPDSQLSRLNRQGYLHRPAAELLEVLSLSHTLHRLTLGAFDPTVQALWRLYADTPQPDAATVRRALKRVDWRQVDFDPQTVRFRQQGMMLTLNGIAQGYITDRISRLLQQAGLQHALVNMGEIRSLLPHGQPPFQAAVRHPQQAGQTLLRIPLNGNRALATSGGYGTQLGGGISHLFHPKTGSGVPLYHSVSVSAGQAAVADALSTAFSVCGSETIRAALAQLGGGIEAWLMHPDGTLQHLAA